MVVVKLSRRRQFGAFYQAYSFFFLHSFFLFSFQKEFIQVSNLSAKDVKIRPCIPTFFIRFLTNE